MTEPTEGPRSGRPLDAGSGELLPEVYEELRAVAERFLSRERKDHTLQATALVHESYLRVCANTKVEWQNRQHFVSIAASTMRRILVDHARKRAAQKRGPDRERVTLSVQEGEGGEPPIDLLLLDEALNDLSELNSRHARVVELRFFGGLSLEEIASELEVTVRTITNDWKMARAWLFRRMVAGT